MSALGERLRARREELGVSLEDVSAEIRIRPKYLQALEEGRFSELPGRVTTKGFLRNYARYLSIDPEEILEAYRQEFPEEHPITVTSGRAEDIFGRGEINVRLRDTVGKRSGAFYLVVLLLAALLAVGGWAYYTGRVDLSSISVPRLPEVPLLFHENTPTPTITPSPTPLPTNTPTPIPTATPTVTPSATPTSTPTSTPTATPALSIKLGLQVLDEAAWVRVVADGKTLQEGTLSPGAKDSWTAKSEMELKVGNAGKVTVYLNGRKLPPIGEVGQVVTILWKAQGGRIVSMTPTPQPK